MVSEKLKARVKIDRILYPRTSFEPGSWAIFSCFIQEIVEGETDQKSVVCKGKPYTLDANVLYTLEAVREDSPKYGVTYCLISLSERVDLKNESAQIAYLRAILTEREFHLVSALPHPFDALVSGDVKQLTALRNVGEHTANRMVNKVKSRLDMAEAYATLGQYGMTVDAITGLLRKFASAQAMLDTIERNPYVMIDTIDGIGWKRADKIAQMKGIEGTDPRRMEAYICYLLKSRADFGDTWISPQNLWDNAQSDLYLTDSAQGAIRDALYTLHEKDVLWWDDAQLRIALREMRDIEEKIAKHLRRLSVAPCKVDAKFSHDALQRIEHEQGWAFTDEQVAAMKSAFDHNVVIITGGAGVGKSSSVSGILKMMDGVIFTQCALSGRAAARLTEVTNEPGFTIHRLLGYQNGHYEFNQDEPLPHELVILDEVSMVGADVFLRLLEALPDGCKLIMLGDDGQLESIGMCNVFKDMLDSGVIPVQRLTKIHRQAAHSAIITESQKVREHLQLTESGWIGRETRGDLRDLEIETYSESILSHDLVVERYQQLLAKGVPYQDIQVIVPMKTRGEACTRTLNNSIQQIVNGNEPMQFSYELEKGAPITLKRNDRVIVTKNMYRAESAQEMDINGDPEICPVYNGDRGIIKSIDEREMIIAFDMWGDIRIARKDYPRIELGYALSCHKLQGSEAPYVIIAIDMVSRVLLTSEWLYTAITRAKTHCTLLAQTSALQYCIRTSHVPNKNTFLCGLLRAAFSETTNILK